MKFIKNGIGIILISVGLMIAVGTFLTWDDMVSANIILLIITALLIFAGVMILRIKKPKITPLQEESKQIPKEEPESLVITEQKQESENYCFKVAGISYSQNDIINNLLKQSSMWEWTKKELIDYDCEDEKIYRYESSIHEVELIPEPDNPYDPNAIKVISDNTLIGYVPKEKTKNVKKLLDTKSPIIRCKFYGGPYKVLVLEDYDISNQKAFYSIKKETENIGAQITMEYEK